MIEIVDSDGRQGDSFVFWGKRMGGAGTEGRGPR